MSGRERSLRRSKAPGKEKRKNEKGLKSLPKSLGHDCLKAVRARFLNAGKGRETALI